MSYEAGSKECRKLIEAKENILKALQSLKDINNAKEISQKLRKIYEELEEMHEKRKEIEQSSS